MRYQTATATEEPERTSTFQFSLTTRARSRRITVTYKLPRTTTRARCDFSSKEDALRFISDCIYRYTRYP